jgi:hypothetical protein
MNAATEYVQMHVVNYEPSYLALREAVDMYVNGDDGIAPARDFLADAVSQHLSGMGLDPEDLTDEVDFAAIVAEEAEV